MKSVLLGFIWLYQRTFSRVTPSFCRFHPTCSNYAAGCLKHHGTRKGLWLSLRRIACCHPFHPGGYDPVPGTDPQQTAVDHAEPESETRSKPEPSTDLSATSGAPERSS